jgi:MGT family glycosyltransferase
VTHEFCAPPFDRTDPAELPDWVHRLPDSPTLYATLGTTFNQAPLVFRAIIAAFSTEAVNVIITVGRTMDPAQFGPLPDHIRVERYIPQSLLLPHCDAFLFHGGYNSLLSALWHRLPMVIIPMEAGDQMPTAHQCAQLGVGVMVEGSPPEPEAIRSAVLTVLKEPSYPAQVERFHREIMALPDLSAAVKRLEVLAETGEPQLKS